MNKLYIAVILLALTVVSVSQIYLWKDQVQQWKMMQTQIQMLNRLLAIQDKPFVYEDETPENYQKKLEDQQI